MKKSDIPALAYSETPTAIPTKRVYDWAAMFEILCAKGWVVLEIPIDHLYPNATSGVMEAPEIKCLNTHARQVQGYKFSYKRITETRWLCVLIPLN